MKEYPCEACNYKTTDKSNYERHLKSKRHIKNIIVYKKSNNMCRYCNNQYESSVSLNRHINSCKEKLTYELKKEHTIELNNVKCQYEAKITILENRLEDVQKMLEMKDTFNQKTEDSTKKTINILEDENKFHKRLVEGSSKLVTDSISAIAYAKKHFPNAKPLIEYTDMEALKTEDGFGIAETMIFYDQNNRIAEVIGKIILNKYKEENPALQSLWNTDFARVAYIIVEGVGDNKRWVVDKGGVKVKSIVIDPILLHIRVKLNEYCHENAKNMGKKFDYNSNAKYFENISNSNSLIKKIDNGITANKIINFLSQYLHISEVRQIKDKA